MTKLKIYLCLWKCKGKPKIVYYKYTPYSLLKLGPELSKAKVE